MPAMPSALARPCTPGLDLRRHNRFDGGVTGGRALPTLKGWNAAKVGDVKDTKHADGPIALQYGAGTVKFRNVRIRQL